MAQFMLKVRSTGMLNGKVPMVYGKDSIGRFMTVVAKKDSGVDLTKVKVGTDIVVEGSVSAIPAISNLATGLSLRYDNAKGLVHIVDSKGATIATVDAWEKVYAHSLS